MIRSPKKKGREARGGHARILSVVWLGGYSEERSARPSVRLAAKGPHRVSWGEDADFGGVFSNYCRKPFRGRVEAEQIGRELRCNRL